MSAPFATALKRDVLNRWPGGLIEYYGTTAAHCVLLALSAVDVRTRWIARAPVPSVCRRARGKRAREPGEVVGHSTAMMMAYHRLSR
jgi:hypothetical protein